MCVYLHSLAMFLACTLIYRHIVVAVVVSLSLARRDEQPALSFPSLMDTSHPGHPPVSRVCAFRVVFRLSYPAYCPYPALPHTATCVHGIRRSLPFALLARGLTPYSSPSACFSTDPSTLLPCPSSKLGQHPHAPHPPPRTHAELGEDIVDISFTSALGGESSV